MPYPQHRNHCVIRQKGQYLAPTSVSLVLRVSALARRMLPGPFDMPLFVSACGDMVSAGSVEAYWLG